MYLHTDVHNIYAPICAQSNGITELYTKASQRCTE